MNRQNPPDSIEWSRIRNPDGSARPGYTWNPVSGCLQGCRWAMPDGAVAPCYAKSVAEGLARASYPHGFAHHYWHPDRLAEPLRVHTPAGIFVDSMGDLFGHWVPAGQVRQVLAVMRQARQHVFLSLTKHAPGLLKYAGELPENLWTGVSLPPTFMWGRRLREGQQYRLFARALAVLAKLEIPVRWLSLEPLSFDAAPLLEQAFAQHGPLVEWIVIGAASCGRRKYQPERAWVANVHAFAEAHGLPVFHKGNLLWPARREDFPTWQAKTRRAVMIYTTRVDRWCARECAARGIVYLDVTRKSGARYTPAGLQAAGGSGRDFAPTDQLLAAGKGWYGRTPISDQAYAERYTAEMRLSAVYKRQSWKWVLNQDAVALACYCPEGAFCHRQLLAALLQRTGEKWGIDVTLGGEIARPRQMDLFESDAIPAAVPPETGRSG